MNSTHRLSVTSRRRIARRLEDASASHGSWMRARGASDVGDRPWLSQVLHNPVMGPLQFQIVSRFNDFRVDLPAASSACPIAPG